ncbi:hypothetical protein scyTo_0013989 [Scyliorhinus torazame]|uniref:Fibronectin type-III domain-containing protein n=1 Tax=Scyliorhinus torazame TaxID=75743 RepID=A0A401NFJ6_SCYTO|nr:hypothetical protein [Scyliorhinus torazame]
MAEKSQDVDCIVYNEEFMKCTWNHSEGKPNYTLYHWCITAWNLNLQNQVKLFPPEDLTLNMTDRNELILSWDAPENSLKCRMYEVKYQSNKDKGWQVHTINSQRKYGLPSTDPKKRYTFQVRSKINEYCGTTVLWSEWSSPVQWGENYTGTAQRNFHALMLFTIVPLLGLLIIVAFQLKGKRTC